MTDHSWNDVQSIVARAEITTNWNDHLQSLFISEGEETFQHIILLPRVTGW